MVFCARDVRADGWWTPAEYLADKISIMSVGNPYLMTDDMLESTNSVASSFLERNNNTGSADIYLGDKLIVVGPDAVNSLTPMKEGDSQTFTVALSLMPSGNVTVNLITEAGLNLDQTRLTFTVTDYSNPQKVTVTATDNIRTDGNRNLNIELSSTGGGYDARKTLVLYIDDDDRGKIVVDPKLTYGLKEGSSTTFTLHLNYEPLGDVTVTLLPGEGLDLDQASLTFTPLNYNVPQTVTLTAKENNMPDNPRWIRVDLIPSGGRFFDKAFIDVQVVDVSKNAEGQEILVVGPNADNPHTPMIEGDSQTFTVALSSMPTGNVTVTLTPDAGLSLDQTRLTFTAINYNTPREVTVTATDNSIAMDNAVLSIDLSSMGGGYNTKKKLFIYLNDDDRGDIEIDPSHIPKLEEGSSTTFAVRLLVEPQNNVTVQLTVNAGDDTGHSPIKLDVSPISLIFTPLNYGVRQTVTVEAVDNGVQNENNWQRINLLASGAGYTNIRKILDVYLLDNDMPVAVGAEPLPEFFSVLGNYPNPFQNSTQLTFDLPWPAHVQVEVMDVLGRKWFTLPESSLEAGWARTVAFRGLSLPAGFYLYRLIADAPAGVSVRTGRFMVVR